jgi:hypothetical protein
MVQSLVIVPPSPRGAVIPNVDNAVLNISMGKSTAVQFVVSPDIDQQTISIVYQNDANE